MVKHVKTEDVDLEQMKKDLDKLVQSNNDKQKALVEMTGGTLDQGFLASLKLEVFMETFLDETAKTVFAYNLQIRLKAMLDEDLKQLRQAQLTQGIGQGVHRLPQLKV